MDCFGKETFGPVVSLYRFHSEDEAVARANDGHYGLNASIYTRDAARGRALARRIRCGTVNVNEAYGATFGSLGAPMGGMRESGMGRRQGAEGILRYTEAQSVATQRLVPIAPMFGMSEETNAKVMTRRCACSTSWAAHEYPSEAQHYDVLVIGSGFGGSVTALRLTEKGYRVGVLEAGARFEDDDFPATSFDAKRFLFAPGAGDVRHPAHRHGQGLPDPRRRRCRRRVAGLRQHALRAARRVLPRPVVGAHHRLEERARALLRPGQADARRGRQPAPHPGRRGDEAGRRRHGCRRHLPPDAGRRLLRRPRRPGRRAGRRPLLRRRRAGPQRLPQLRRVHDRVPAQRQEHPGQELPPPRRAGRRGGPPADHGDARPAPRRRRLRGHAPAGPRPSCRGGTWPPRRSPPTRSSSPRPRSARRSCSTSSRARATCRASATGSACSPAPTPRRSSARWPPTRPIDYSRGRRDHVVVAPRRGHPHRAVPLRPRLQRDGAHADGAGRRHPRHLAGAHLAARSCGPSGARRWTSTTSGTGRSARSSRW